MRGDTPQGSTTFITLFASSVNIALLLSLKLASLTKGQKERTGVLVWTTRVGGEL